MDTKHVNELIANGFIGWCVGADFIARDDFPIGADFKVRADFLADMGWLGYGINSVIVFKESYYILSCFALYPSSKRPSETVGKLQTALVYAFNIVD